jgi:hypothetical protein
MTVHRQIDAVDGVHEPQRWDQAGAGQDVEGGQFLVVDA